MELRDETYKYPVEKQELIYHGQVFDFQSDQVRLHKEEPLVRRDYLAHPGAVAIAALRPVQGADESSKELADWEILLLRQYRHPVRAFLWEIPAGLLDKTGEDRLSAARRELWEEANLQATNWKVLVDFFTSPGGSSEHLRIFLARGISAASGKPFERREEERDMCLAWFPLDQARDALLSGSLHNPSALAAVLASIESLRNGWRSLRSPSAPFVADPLLLES